MSTMASQNTSLMIVYSTIYSDTDQRKHQNSTSLAFVRGIHRWPVNSPHKRPVTQKIFPFDDVIMLSPNMQDDFEKKNIMQISWHFCIISGCASIWNLSSWKTRSSLSDAINTILAVDGAKQPYFIRNIPAFEVNVFLYYKHILIGICQDYICRLPMLYKCLSALNHQQFCPLSNR